MNFLRSKINLIQGLGASGLAIGVVKFFGPIKTRLQGVLMLIGLAQFIARPRVHPLFVPFLAAFLLALFSAVMKHDAYWTSVGRFFQILLMVGVAHFFSELKSSNFEKRIISFWAFLSPILMIIQYLSLNEFYVSRLIPILNRFPMIIGEPNYSGLIYLYSCIRCLSNRWYLLFTAHLGFMILTGGRTSLAGLIIYAVVIGLWKIRPNLGKILSIITFLFLFSYPGILKVVDNHITQEQKHLLVKLTSHRYYIHLIYTKMGLDAPIGKGLGFAESEYSAYIKKWESFVRPRFSSHALDGSSQQHSLYLKVLSEAGVIGFFLLFLSFSGWLYLAIRSGSQMSGLFIAILANVAFLNASNELALYLVFGLLIKESQNMRPVSSFSLTA